MPRTMSQRGAPSATELHRRWLELVTTDGPFLAVPALKRVWPQGMPALDPDARAVADRRQTGLRSGLGTLGPPARRRGRAGRVPGRAGPLGPDDPDREVVGWHDSYVKVDTPRPEPAQGRHPQIAHGTSPELVEGLSNLQPAVSPRPPGARRRVGGPGERGPDRRAGAGGRPHRRPLDCAGGRLGGQPAGPDGGSAPGQRHPDRGGHRRPLVGPGRRPDRRDGRLRHGRRPNLGRGGRRPGRLLRVAVAPTARRRPGRGPAAGAYSPSRWQPPRKSPRRWAYRSAARSNCWSVRLSEAAVEARHRGEPDPLPAERHQVYEAAVTVMMRVVFLLFAEERSLLPQSELFTQGLRDQRPARRARRPGPGGGGGGAGRQPPHLAPAAGHLAGPARGGQLRGSAAACVRRVAVRPAPVRLPARPDRAGHLEPGGQRPGDAGRCCGRSRWPSSEGPAGPADQLPRYRRGADRLHLRRSAGLQLRRDHRGHRRADRVRRGPNRSCRWPRWRRSPPATATRSVSRKR